MISAYMAKEGQVVGTDFSQKDSAYFWIDLYQPTMDEIKSVEDRYGIKIPLLYTQNGNVINRFSHDDQACFMMLCMNKDENIILVLKENILITINNSNKIYWGQIKNQIMTMLDAFVLVVEAFIQNITAELETLEQNTCVLSETIKQYMRNEVVRNTKQTTEQKIMIMNLNDARDIITQHHNILINLRLLLNFSKKCTMQIPEHIGQNVDALITHTDFLSNKTSALHSTVFSYLGITQYNLQASYNIFSAIFFLPVLIMSFFSMNFIDIPFLKVENSIFFFIFIAVLGTYLLYHYLGQLQFA